MNGRTSSTDGRGRVLTGVSPRHGSHAALLIACDAFNARAVTAKEYQCTDLCVLARKPPRLHYGVVSVARSPLGKSWRTRRTARHKPKVSVLLYTAPPLSCGLSFSSYIQAVYQPVKAHSGE